MAMRSLSVAIKSEEGPIAINVVSDTCINLTPAQVTSIRKIGKWEFLSMQMEEMAILHLPRIQQLNTKFIDEARTKTFYETGSWSGNDREQMYRHAERRMKRRLARSNAYKLAEQNGREQMTALMKAFGFRTTIVVFEK